MLQDGIETLVMAREELGQVIQEKEVLKTRLDEKLWELGKRGGDKGRRSYLLAKRDQELEEAREQVEMLDNLL